MEFYIFAASAIPILWAATRLAQPQAVPHRWQTVAWFGLKLLLLGAEVAAVLTVGRGRASEFGVWLISTTLIAGGLVIAVPPVAGDLARLGLRATVGRMTALVMAGLVGWLVLRFA